jgi:predicted glycosyltransferase
LKILIDINHPAHAHFFRNPIRLLQEQGHEIMVTSRDKEMAIDLLEELGIPNRKLSSLGSGGLLSLGKELVVRNLALLAVVREFGPEAMAAIGGTSIAQVGFLARVPSLVFYDTENATLQNAITYPFSSCVLVPRCYSAWLPKKRHVRYAGYHELSYLGADYFEPDLEIAKQSGLNPDRDSFFLRIVSWQANHDVGEAGWTPETLSRLIDKLGPLGDVIISSERELPGEFTPYLYRGKVSDVHHVLGHCRLFIGESATMASECAVLGVPAIYAAETGRGYTTEQEERYGLVTNISSVRYELIVSAIDDMLALDRATLKSRHERLLGETIDVARFVADSITGFPDVLHDYRKSSKAA